MRFVPLGGLLGAGKSTIVLTSGLRLKQRGGKAQVGAAPANAATLGQVAGSRTDPQSTPQATVGQLLSPRALAWLADHSRARKLVHSVWDILTELERTGHHPAAIAALRGVLIRHQPTSAGRCRTCPRWAWRRRRFPCIVWYRVRECALQVSPDSGEPGSAVRAGAGTWRGWRGRPGRRSRCH